MKSETRQRLVKGQIKSLEGKSSFDSIKRIENTLEGFSTFNISGQINKSNFNIEWL